MFVLIQKEFMMLWDFGETQYSNLSEFHFNEKDLCLPNIKRVTFTQWVNTPNCVLTQWKEIIEYPGWNNYSLSAWIAENIPAETFNLREHQCSKQMSSEKALHLHPCIKISCISSNLRLSLSIISILLKSKRKLHMGAIKAQAKFLNAIFSTC